MTIKEEHDQEQGEAFKAELLKCIDAIIAILEEPEKPKLNWWQRFWIWPR